VSVLRNGDRVELKARIVSLEEALKKMAASAQQRLGVVVRPVSDAEAQQYGMQEPQGVSIASLEPNGPLAQAGFEVDDIILAVNKIPVPGVQGFVDIIDALKPDQRAQVTVLDHRSGQVGNILVKVK
jgi:S1-C subfamily serine protease